MDRVIQQTAANAEESASTSQQMNAQAGQMKLMVEDLVKLVGVKNKQFDIDGNIRIDMNDHKRLNMNAEESNLEFV